MHGLKYLLMRGYFRGFHLDRDLKDRHSGGEALLIGNGPSVDVEILEKIRGPVTFCFNRFYLAYEQFSLKFTPHYTVCIDPQVIRDFGPDIVEFSKGVILFGTCRRITFPGEYKCFPLMPTRPFRFSGNMERYVSTGDSVVVAAVQIAYYMGIRKMYLYGVDHNFKIERRLENGRVTGDDNHFLMEYRSEKAWHPPNLLNIENAFKSCESFLKSKDGFLINCTDGGRLEVLPRKDIRKVFVV